MIDTFSAEYTEARTYDAMLSLLSAVDSCPEDLLLNMRIRLDSLRRVGTTCPQHHALITAYAALMLAAQTESD